MEEAGQCFPYFWLNFSEYISTGSYQVDEFYHYGLAADFYTHFTSPIRRFADVIVHRSLNLEFVSDHS